MELATATNSTVGLRIVNTNTQDGFSACCAHVTTAFHQFLHDIKFYDEATRLGKKITSNPILFTAVLLVCAVFLIPILCFVIFALFNAVLGLTGFVMIQVAVLTVAVSVLGCTLFFTVATLGFFGLFIGQQILDMSDSYLTNTVT